MQTWICENLVQLHALKNEVYVSSVMFRDVDFRLMS